MPFDGTARYVDHEAAAQLRAARKLIEDRRHWQQGSYISPDRQAGCLVMVLAMAVAGREWPLVDGREILMPRRRRPPVFEYLTQVCVCGGAVDAPHFNDQPGRTHKEVLAVLDAAAELAESPDFALISQKEKQHAF